MLGPVLTFLAARPRWSRGVVTAYLALAGLISAPGAGAATPPARTIGLQRRGGKLLVSVGLSDIFRNTDIDKLRSGLVSRILIRVYLYRGDSPVPVAQTLRRSEILYDIWDERFTVRTTDGVGQTEIKNVIDVVEAVRAGTTLLGFAVSDVAALLPGAVYRVGLRADLNPISQELVGEVRRWLARTPGKEPALDQDSFFGSFVSIFVNPRVDDSERQLRFFSQTFVEPAR